MGTRHWRKIKGGRDIAVFNLKRENEDKAKQGGGGGSLFCV